MPRPERFVRQFQFSDYGQVKRLKVALAGPHWNRKVFIEWRGSTLTTNLHMGELHLFARRLKIKRMPLAIILDDAEEVAV